MAGIWVEFSREGHARRRLIHTKLESGWDSSSASSASLNSADAGEDDVFRHSSVEINGLNSTDDADEENDLSLDGVVAEEDL